jgi:hypothetical protein
MGWSVFPIVMACVIVCSFGAGLVLSFRKSVAIFRLAHDGTLRAASIRWALLPLSVYVLLAVALFAACGMDGCTGPAVKAAYETLVLFVAPATFTLAISTLLPPLPFAIVGGAVGVLTARVFTWVR